MVSIRFLIYIFTITLSNDYNLIFMDLTEIKCRDFQPVSQHSTSYKIWNMKLK